MKITQRFLCLLIVIFTLLVLHPGVKAQTASADDPVTIKPSDPKIRVGNSVEVTITSSEAITPKDVSWSENDFVKVKSEQRGAAVVSVLQAKSFSPTTVEMTVTVKTGEKTFEKKVQVTTLTSVLPADFTADPPDSFTMTLDQPKDTKSVLITIPSGVIIPPEGLEAIPVPESFVEVSVRRETGVIVIKAIKPGGPSRVAVKSNGQTIKTYTVTVDDSVERITAVGNIRISEGTSIPLSDLNVKVTGKSNVELTTQAFAPTYSPLPAGMVQIVEENSVKKLKAIRAPKTGEEPPRLKITSGEKELLIPIQIVPAANTINLITQGNNVFVGKSETFLAEVIDTLGTPIPDAQIEWSLSTADQAYLAIMNSRGTQVTVQGLKPTDQNGVKLKATLKSQDPNSTPPSREFLLNVKSANVTGFAPLQIRIDLLDSQTAKDLFGKKAADEFFIAKIRLFNKLKNQNGEYGDSILVYSESLEIRVQLEMRDKKGGEWKAIPEGSKNDNDPDSYYSLFGNPEPPPDVPGTPPCKDNPQNNFVARYRPYTFDIVANTHDRRDERSIRSRILTLANGLSSLGSFVTTIAVPAPGNDTRLGLDQFKGLLIPSFEKLFPSLKEVQRQNIISMVMRPLEEIPFGSDVTRILFIPKGRLHGMIPDKIFRIGGVSTLGACAEVGIIKKAGSTQ